MGAGQLEPVISSTITRHRARYGERLDVLAHVVDAQDRRAALVGGDRGGDARRDRAGRRIGVAEQRPSELLRENPITPAGRAR